MSKQLNVEAVRRIYQLTNNGDLPSVLNMVSDDVELFLFGSPKVPWAGHWRGRQGAEKCLMAMGKAAEVNDTPDVLVGAGDLVIALTVQECGYEQLAAMPTSIVFMFGVFVTAWSFE